MAGAIGKRKRSQSAQAEAVSKAKKLSRSDLLELVLASIEEEKGAAKAVLDYSPSPAPDDGTPH